MILVQLFVTLPRSAMMMMMVDGVEVKVKANPAGNTANMTTEGSRVTGSFRHVCPCWRRSDAINSVTYLGNGLFYRILGVSDTTASK